LAVAFDPNFSTNHYVYLHYTRKATSTTSVHNRLVRVTASGGRAVAGSEKLIFRLGTKHKTVVTTGAQDLAGNRLDQNPSLSGLQQKAWTFTIRN
jgi:hypothetical protein